LKTIFLYATAIVLSLCTILVLYAWSDYVYKQGYKQGQEDFNWRKALAEDPKMTSKACMLWWFNMTHEERKLDVPKRGRK